MIYKKQNYIGFTQIVDLIVDKILLGEYVAEDKIPSVREMAEEVEVTPNTVVRAYERLDMAEVIYTQRGLGFFVSADALEKVRAIRLRELKEEELPRFIQKCKVLGLTMEEMIKLLEEFEVEQLRD